MNIAHPIAYGLGLIYTLIDGTYSLVYASYCSRYSPFRFGRTMILQTLSSPINQSDLIYLVFRNLPHFTLLSFVLVKFFYLFIQQMKCREGSSSIHQQQQANEKNRPLSFVSSTFSIDAVIPDYQTKPEFCYTQGKTHRVDLLGNHSRFSQDY